MRIDEMEMLVRVAETGSMTRAARQMHVTPAAVSAAVRRVEEGLGVRLFERTTRSIHPTDEGLVVLEGCQEVVDRWRQTLEDVRGDARNLSGTVHVSAPADTTYELLAPVIVEVSAAHPDLQIVVHSSDTVQHLHR
ncbi:MAG: LysR family transcriptional regulator, partial [Polyangiaceae bacterium]